MAGARNIPREKATAALSALLQTISDGGRYADCVTAVHVFGSYARGALAVGDVDVNIEYDAKLDAVVEREVLDMLVSGRDWNTPFRKALKPARALQVMFNRRGMLAEAVAVYERGDDLNAALARVSAIKPDPDAGRAQRDPVHPAIESVAEDLTRPTRILLTELITAGLLTVEFIELADAQADDLADRRFRAEIRLRWSSATSPLARAARAAGAYLQSANVDLDTVALMPRGVRAPQDPRWAVDCRETHVRAFVVYLGYNAISDGLFVLHPERKRPLRAMRLIAPDPTALPADDIDGWLSKRAPQINRIG
jgi:predicted nucleotidyltransferase